jgi:hypothetical protein
MRKRSWWFVPIVLGSVAAMTANAEAVTRLPARVVQACEKAHIMSLCSHGGHFTKFGNVKVFMLDRGTRILGAHVANTGYQSLYNHGTGLCMSDYYGWNNYLKQYGCNSGPNQTWNIGFGFNGGWFVQANDGGCMNVKGNSYNAYTPLIDYQCNGGLNESFLVQDNGSCITLNAIAANVGGSHDGSTGVIPSNLCVSGMGYYTYGSYVLLFGCNSNNNQTWGHT